MRVLLVDPRAPSFGLNVAIGYLSAGLKAAGIEVRTLDLNNRRSIQSDDDIIRIVQEYKPDLIGFSVMYVSYERVLQYSRIIKKHLDTRIILGGPQIAIEQEKVLSDCDAIDYVLVGEGERRLPELCGAIAADGNLSGIKGLIYWENGSIRVNPPEKPNRDVDGLPFPDYESFGITRIDDYPIMTSRGCPYDCTYCFRQFKRDWRPRTPENIIAELKEARRRYGIKNFLIHDDSFNINKRRVLEFCKMLSEEGIGMEWRCAGVRADAIDDEVAAAMAGAGCQSVSIGVETLDPEVFARIDKGESIDDILGAIDALKKNRIKVLGYFIIGLPGDSYKGVMRTFKKARELELEMMSWALLLPIPKTKIYDEIYDDPLTTKINDYRKIDVAWNKELSEVKVAFDHPSFTARERLKAYYRINTKLGYICPRLDRPVPFIFLESILLVLRHAPHRLPLYIGKYLVKIAVRLGRGRAPIKMLGTTYENLQFRPDYLLADVS